MSPYKGRSHIQPHPQRQLIHSTNYLLNILLGTTVGLGTGHKARNEIGTYPDNLKSTQVVPDWDKCLTLKAHIYRQASG